MAARSPKALSSVRNPCGVMRALFTSNMPRDLTIAMAMPPIYPVVPLIFGTMARNSSA